MQSAVQDSRGSYVGGGKGTQVMDVISGIALSLERGKDRRDQAWFQSKLSSLQLVQAQPLPWGKSRGVGFQSFMMSFFHPNPNHRPLAVALAENKALPR